MNGFFWTSGHLGWSFFSLVVFTGLWWLAFDLVWRLKSVKIRKLAIVVSSSWVLGVVLITVAFYLIAL